MTEQEKAWKAYSSNDTLRPSSYECFQAGWVCALTKIREASIPLDEHEPDESILHRIQLFVCTENGDKP